MNGEPSTTKSGVTALDQLMAKLDRAPSTPASSTQSLVVIRGDQATEKPLRWMWKPYLPLGKLVHFGGNSSQAKSPVTIDLAARISVGTQWLDGTTNDKGPRDWTFLHTRE